MSASAGVNVRRFPSSTAGTSLIAGKMPNWDHSGSESMLTHIVQVLRYSALGLGVFYGITHQRSLTAQQRKAASEREWANKEKLIQKAKAEYARSKQPASSKSKGRELGPFFPIHRTLRPPLAHPLMSCCGSSRIQTENVRLTHAQ